jgi:hypothetical protein
LKFLKELAKKQPGLSRAEWAVLAAIIVVLTVLAAGALTRD